MIFDKLKAYGWMAAAIALGAVAGMQTLRLHTAQLDAAQTRTAHADTLRKIADLTAAAERAVRAEETQRAQKLEAIANGTQKQIDAARVDAAAAARSADGLRKQLASYVAAARATSANPGTAAPGETASDAIDVLADMLVKLDERAGIYAEAADRSRIAGVSCEQAYSALAP